MEFINQNILLISVVVMSAAGLIMPMFVRSGGQAVNPAAATLLINREDAQVVDVREAAEFSDGHVPDSRNIPLAKLGERAGELDKYKDRALIVCCATGMRSGKAIGQLKQLGFSKLYNLEGGVDAWVGAGLPIKKGTRK